MAGLVQLMEAGKAERTKARQLAVQAGYVCMSRATIDRLAHPTVSQQPSLARGVCRRRVRAADTRTCVQACEIGPLVAMARTDCGLARVCQPIGQALKSSCKRTIKHQPRGTAGCYALQSQSVSAVVGSLLCV
jgi:hypothetical protein